MNPVIVIPARMASSRLPGKPLADIAGKPMILQVLDRAQEAGLGPIIVASGDGEISAAVRAAGGLAIDTDPDLPSGSDRIHAALEAFDPDKKYDVVVNLQGDLPTISAETIKDAVRPLADPVCDIATLAAEIVEEREKTDPNVTKAVVSLGADAAIGRALYFTRATAPTGEGPLWHHIGIYAYRRAALDRFVALPPSPLEVRERLEQLRALEAGMQIHVAIVDTVPDGVDTPADLERARQILGS